jgi:hypothetical protein
VPKVLKSQKTSAFQRRQESKNYMRRVPMDEDIRKFTDDRPEKYRIAQVLRAGSQWGSVTPNTLNQKGLGGRETAIIKLAEQWALEGHEVHSFVQVDEPKHYY